MAPGSGSQLEPLIHFAKAFVPGMAEAGWGRIVATGSAVTLHPQTRDLAYITSKAAVHGVVKALANELGGSGITVNAIAPTVVKTEGNPYRIRRHRPRRQNTISPWRLCQKSAARW